MHPTASHTSGSLESLVQQSSETEINRGKDGSSLIFCTLLIALCPKVATTEFKEKNVLREVEGGRYREVAERSHIHTAPEIRTSRIMQTTLLLFIRSLIPYTVHANAL